MTSFFVVHEDAREGKVLISEPRDTLGCLLCSCLPLLKAGGSLGMGACCPRLVCVGSQAAAGEQSRQTLLMGHSSRKKRVRDVSMFKTYICYTFSSFQDFRR